MYGISLSGLLLAGVTLILLLQFRQDRRRARQDHQNRDDSDLVTCPLCRGQGVLPVGHPSGDPQLDRERECPDCLGDGALTRGEFDQLTPAQRLGERIIRELARNGYQVVVSEYPGMPALKRWEAGAFTSIGTGVGRGVGSLAAGPYTAPTYLGAVSQVAQKLNVDVRRITS